MGVQKGSIDLVLGANAYTFALARVEILNRVGVSSRPIALNIAWEAIPAPDKL